MLCELSTPSEVARQVGVSAAAVRAALKDPDCGLQGVKVGRRLYVIMGSVGAYQPRAYPRHLAFAPSADARWRGDEGAKSDQ